MSDLNELIRLSKILVERDGQRLYKAANSPAIIGVRTTTGTLWIKRVRQHLMLTLSFNKDNARTCVYDEQPGVEPTFGAWGPWLVPYLERIQRRLVLDAISSN